MPATSILIVVSLYLFGLFLLARWGERHAKTGVMRGRPRAIVLGLALGVYCSTWTVFGAIGSAVREGYAYLPIYLGPLFIALITPFVWERLIRLKQYHRLASVADLLSARYGRASTLPAIASVISLIAVVPYLALQLTALGGSLQALGIVKPFFWVFLFALLMVIFTLRFGVRDARTLVERPGLLLMLGIESAIKLFILLAVACWAWLLVDGTPLDWHTAMSEKIDINLFSLAGQTLLAMVASLLLPRMFQVGVVECSELSELKIARWVFSGYLLLVMVAVLPIAALANMNSQTFLGSDYLLISLPLERSQSLLALLAFIAGLSAASAMMIAALLALSTMLSNNLLVPILLRTSIAITAERVLKLRRVSVIITAIMSLSWYAFAQSGTLVQMGLLAFAGIAQFAPAVYIGLYSERVNGLAALSAILVGTACWLVLLLLPSLNGNTFSSAELSARALLALSLNLFTLIGISILKPASLRQRRNAAIFLTAADQIETTSGLSSIRTDDLFTLAEMLLGAAHFRSTLALHYGEALPSADSQANPKLLAAAERAIAEVFGTASARELITRGLSGRALSMSAVFNALDQSSMRYRISTQLLNTTFEHMHQGVSVVDAELNLVAWNRRYENLFNWPIDLLVPGRPIADLIDFTARSSGLNEWQIAERVSRRLSQLRAATPYQSQREQADGRIFDVRGEPLPDGGFVTTFFDVTDAVHAANALEEANALLEERVAARTRELQKLGELKNQFLAAASHDLLQPMSAARLYLAAAQSAAGEERELLIRAESAMYASEELLSGLTDLARLETGQLKPDVSAIDLNALLGSIETQTHALAVQRGLNLRVYPTKQWVDSDPRLLRRILQNFVANALRYTARGTVLIGVRQRSHAMLDIVVLDTGPGIDDITLAKLFGNLDESASVSPWGDRGSGLGLAGCKRLADALGHQLVINTRLGRGSQFSVRVPLSRQAKHAAISVEPMNTRAIARNILCIDDNDDVRTGLHSLLERWGAHVWSIANPDQAHQLITEHKIDIVLVDYALGDGIANGLDVIENLRERTPHIRAVLITAETKLDVYARATAAGILYLKKPLRPAALRALIESSR